MRFLARCRLFAAALLCVIAGSATLAIQTPAPSVPASAPLTEQMPLDTAITSGKFQNGLRYFIRTTRRPEKRAELRLVVNVGSIVEDDDQQGLAHFVEHMAFNGTKNFPKQETVDVSRIARHAVRPEHQCLHELRRDRLHAAGPDREAGSHGSRVPDPRGLGARPVPSTRRRSTRSAASSRKSGDCAAAPAPGCRTSSCRSC